MHRTLRLTALAALVALPLSAQAQTAEPRAIQFGISGGLTMPMGDVGDVYSSGFNVTGHVTMRPGTLANLSFRGDVALDRFSAKRELSLVTQEGSFTSIGVTVNAVYAFPQSDPSALMRPYILGGAGFYNLRTNLTTQLGENSLSSEGSETKAGIQGGAGVEFNLAGFSTFAEAKFVNVFGDGGSARWVPISFGFRF